MKRIPGLIMLLLMAFLVTTPVAAIGQGPVNEYPVEIRGFDLETKAVYQEAPGQRSLAPPSPQAGEVIPAMGMIVMFIAMAMTLLPDDSGQAVSAREVPRSRGGRPAS